MGVIWRSLILSVIDSVSCKVFFETAASRRRWKHAWFSCTMLLVWTAGYLVIAFTKIPPYILQPIRLIAVVSIGAGIYFRVTIKRNLFLSVLFSTLVWICTLASVVALGLLPVDPEMAAELTEYLSAGLLLGMLLLLKFWYERKKGSFCMTEGVRWSRLSWFPVVSLLSVVTFSSVGYGSSTAQIEVFAACAGLLLVNAVGLYFMGNLLVQEAEIRKLGQIQEQTKNQMRLYENMKQSYEKQRRFVHDYKNQLDCIQGLLAGNHIEKAVSYIEELGGTVRKISDHVNTNHAAVNVILNQKYEYAKEKGITMVIQVNDLSGLLMSEEDIVTILANLIDNAMEACDKLEDGKLIQFKMILEEEQLILSVKNPVKEPVKVRNNTVVTTKKDKKKHGIGLRNVRLAVEKNGGTSVLRCEDGWFCFSMVIPTCRKPSFFAV